LVVAGTVVLAVLLCAAAPSAWWWPSRLLLAPVLVVLSTIDIRERRLPDRIVLPAVSAGFALLVLGALGDGEPSHITGALAGAAIFAGLLFVLHLASPAGLGFGDVKLGLLLGLYLGAVSLGLVLWGLLLGSLVGVVAALPVAVRTRDRRAGIPFGPALAAGTVLALILAGPLGA
jgi:leader peptidase (prepilin peptidase)/N-methyltransferase